MCVCARACWRTRGSWGSSKQNTGLSWGPSKQNTGLSFCETSLLPPTFLPRTLVGHAALRLLCRAVPQGPAVTRLSHPARSRPCSESRLLPVGLWALASHCPPSRPATGSWFYPGPGHRLRHCPEESRPPGVPPSAAHLLPVPLLCGTIPQPHWGLWSALDPPPSSPICHLQAFLPHVSVTKSLPGPLLPVSSRARRSGPADPRSMLTGPAPHLPRQVPWASWAAHGDPT